MDEAWDVSKLAANLKVLANPNRLELLRQLRQPMPVRSISLHPEAVPDGENPGRRISHQAVREHLAKLREAGLVRIRPRAEAGSVSDHYFLDHAHLFALVEELHDVGALRADVPLETEETMVGMPPADVVDATGPRLVLVHGQGAGRVFPLDEKARGRDGAWWIGRRHDAAACLDYDPFVSAENARIRYVADHFRLADVEGSRNGTWRNFARLGPGAEQPLRHGDIVAVGRTRLVFHHRQPDA